jgi:hypothetical protein
MLHYFVDFPSSLRLVVLPRHGAESHPVFGVEKVLATVFGLAAELLCVRWEFSVGDPSQKISLIDH